jgi:CRISPR-associated protein Csm2
MPHQHHRSRHQQTSKELPQIKLNLKEDPDLLDKTARIWAEAIHGTNKHQLRNFYDKVLELKEELNNKEFSQVYPFIKMLNSKVAYARNRKVVSWEFQKMMEQCLDQITNDEAGKEKFEIFQLFLEAVLGFFR